DLRPPRDSGPREIARHALSSGGPHPSGAFRLAEEREDRVGDRARLVPHMQSIDSFAYDLAKRWNVASDHREAGAPGLEVGKAEGLVVRWHRENRRARIGLRLVRLGDDPAVDPARVAHASV